MWRNCTAPPEFDPQLLVLFGALLAGRFSGRVSSALFPELLRRDLRIGHTEASVPTWHIIVEEWLASTDIRTERTRQQYQSNLRCHVLPFLEGKPSGQITARDLCQVGTFCLDRTSSTTLKASTPMNIACFARKFFRFVGNCGYQSVSALEINQAIPTPRVDDQRSPRVLNAQELGLLFENVADARDRALLALLALSGLRVSEVLGLETTEVEEKAVLVRKAKGGKQRRVPLSPSTFDGVKEYVTAVGLDLGAQGPLFPAVKKPSNSLTKNRRKVDRKCGTPRWVAPSDSSLFALFIRCEVSGIRRDDC